MTTRVLPPPITAPADVDAQLAREGFAVLDSGGLAALAGVPPAELTAWAPSWDRLPVDHYLKDGGRYRRRRHSCFVVEEAGVTKAPHRAHWQPLDYNALHGGIERMFEPIEPSIVGSPAWPKLLGALGARAGALFGAQRWYVEAHPFRIDTSDGIGRPTPEGAHRDGVDLVAVILVAREGIKGGETRVFRVDGPEGIRFTLTEPWSALLLDDHRMIHESTPIQPLDPEALGRRDTLVVTFRAGGFQRP
jgi:hypothetical protein